jgi:hypothetical protein
MNTCPTCGSHAINPGQNGREIGVNKHLCDVCYWRTEAERLEEDLSHARAEADRLAVALEKELDYQHA